MPARLIKRLVLNDAIAAVTHRGQRAVPDRWLECAPLLRRRAVVVTASVSLCGKGSSQSFSVMNYEEILYDYCL